MKASYLWKKPPTFQKASDKSWAVLGWDTSMSSVCCVGMGYDATLDAIRGPSWGEIRWTGEVDYFDRLGEAARAHDLTLDVLGRLNMLCTLERTLHAIEEPFPLGMIKHSLKSGGAWTGSYIKQLCQVSGSVEGSLVRYGYKNIYEINNSQWAKTLRDEGVPLLPQNRKDPDKKWKIKEWAISAFDLPEFPDLVKDKNGAKMPRPESGFGAKAKAVQPSDIYDAAAICAWGMDFVTTTWV